MGAANVAWALARAGPLLGQHHRTRVALCQMALMALDTDLTAPNGDPIPARMYFGGWKPIAHALGLKGSPESQEQAVSRALKVAKDLGLIEVVQRPRKGRSATVFRLNFAAASLAPDTQEGLVPDTQVTLAPHTQAEEEGRTREEGRTPTSATTDRARFNAANQISREKQERQDHLRAVIDAENQRKRKSHDQHEDPTRAVRPTPRRPRGPEPYERRPAGDHERGPAL